MAVCDCGERGGLFERFGTLDGWRHYVCVYFVTTVCKSDLGKKIKGIPNNIMQSNQQKHKLWL